MADSALVQKLYIAYFGRPADVAGATNASNLIDWTGSAASLLTDFGKSAEYTAQFSGLTSNQIVNKIYNNLFGRDAEASGLNFWSAKIAAGQITLANAVWTILSGVTTGSGDDTAVNSKVTWAQAFTTALSSNAAASVAYNAATIDSVKTQMLAIKDAATLATANTGLSAFVTTMTTNGSGVAGTTFTLTTGVDNITGTAGNDIIIGDNTSASKQLTTADQINGGLGTDTLKVYLNAADTGTGQPTLTNIENVWINGGVITAYTAATGTTGLTVEAPVLTGGALAAATYTIAGQTVTLKDANVTGNSTTLLTSTTDTTENVTLSNWTATGATNTVGISGAKVATLNLTSTGSANKIVLANAGTALTTLNISGDKALTLTEGLAGLKTINASAATGNVAVDASTATLDAAFAFTGGSGNDSLTLKAGALALITAGSQLNGGTGTDTLVLNETAALTAAQVAKVNAATGFEVLGFGTTGSGVDVSGLTGINQFKVGAPAAGAAMTETFTNATSASKFTIDNSAGNTGTVSIANKVGETATTVTLDTGTAAAAQTLATLTLTGITNVALASTGAAGNVITTLNNADNSAITITGAADLTLTTKATAIGSKVDGSAATGKLTLTGNNTGYLAGSSLGDTLIGGSAADTLKASVNNGTLTGNAGNDTFDVSAALGGTASLTTITDFTKGDILKVKAGTGTEVFTATKLDVSAATTLAAALDLAAAGDGAAANSIVKWFQFGGNTYVVEDMTAGATFATTDIAVKLTGTLDLSTATWDAVANTLTFA